MAMKVICHIGNPKAWSTSIQYLLTTSQDESLHYLGFRPSKNKNNWYQDKTISELLNFDLRYTSSEQFAVKYPKYKLYFEKIISKCGSDKDLWVSSENLSMRFILQDIDVLEKFKRIQSILPDGTIFILIFRNILESLISIYSEYIKLGYTYGFVDFCNETYLFGDANFLHSLFPGELISLLQKNLHGNNNIKWHFIGKSSNEEKHLMNFLNSLKSEGKFKDLCRKNAMYEKGDIFKLRKLNGEQCSFIDSSGLIENHRSFWHLEKMESIYFDSIIWDKLRRQKKNRKKIECQYNLEDYQVTSNLHDFILKVYKEDKDKYTKVSKGDDIELYDGIWKFK